jgi:tol-pal system protein YbgF
MASCCKINPLILSSLLGGFMSLKNVSGLNSGLKYTWFVFLSLVAFLLIGCGGSEEATMQTPNPQDTTTKSLGTVEQQKPKEVKPMEEALTNFIGADTGKVVEAPKPAVVAPAQLAQYEKQIEDLRTENTDLKQKNVKLEQENRGINARISDAEAKYAAEKLRADRVEESAKNTAQAPKAEEEKPVSTSAYDVALKAFNSRKYDAAAKGFKAIVADGSNADLTSRAKYWLGETYYAQKKYNEALPLFQESLKLKNSAKKADAQFMIAQTYDRLGNKVKAKAAYEKVVKDYPMSKNVKRAKARWAKL